MSYNRMLEEEKRLSEEIHHLKQQTASMLERAEEMDKVEDTKFGAGQRDEDLPAELRRREDRLARIQEAKSALEAEAKQTRARALRRQASRAQERSVSSPDEIERKRASTRARNQRDKADELDPSGDDAHGDPPQTRDGLPLHEPRVMSDGTPHPKAQRCFTDPDSPIMEGGGAFLQGFNYQAAVDDVHQIIVAQAVTNQSPDNGNLAPMLEMVRANCGQAPAKLTADAGYWSAQAPAECTRQGTDVFISTKRKKHGRSEDVPDEPKKNPDDARTAMRRKLQTPEGRAIYRRRKAVVEPVFGQVKEARGFRRFLLNGLTAAHGEWSLVCAGHNLLKLYRFRRLQTA